MDNLTHAVRLEQWTTIVQNCANSGLTKKEWCRQNNIKTKTYYYWQRRVRKHALMMGNNSSVPDTSFTEIRIREPLTGCPQASGTPHSFQPDVVIRNRTLTIEISNTASDRLLTLIGKVTTYA